MDEEVCLQHFAKYMCLFIIMNKNSAPILRVLLEYKFRRDHKDLIPPNVAELERNTIAIERLTKEWRYLAYKYKLPSSTYVPKNSSTFTSFTERNFANAWFQNDATMEVLNNEGSKMANTISPNLWMEVSYKLKSS